MNLERFDEGLHQRHIVAYDPVYAEIVLALQTYVHARAPDVQIVHIGSTAIVGLRGKPMIDVVAITTRGDLRGAQKEMERIGFHRRPVWGDTDEKP